MCKGRLAPCRGMGLGAVLRDVVKCASAGCGKAPRSPASQEVPRCTVAGCAKVVRYHVAGLAKGLRCGLWLSAPERDVGRRPVVESGMRPHRNKCRKCWGRMYGIHVHLYLITNEYSTFLHFLNG